MLTRLSILPAIILTAACEGPIEERYAEAVCAKSFECCEAAEIPADATEEECRNNLELGVSSMITEAEEDDAAGRVDYSEANLEKCLEAIEKAGCGDWPAVIDEGACTTVIVAAVEVNGACEDDDQCISGACDIDSQCMDGSCMGTCAATSAENGDCSSVSCGPDLYCDNSVCLPKKGAGETCGSFAECLSGSCDSTCAEAECYRGCRALGTGSALAAIAALLLLAWRRRW